MRRVVLHFNSANHHFSQLIAGLEYLKNKRHIELYYNFSPGRYAENIFKLEVSGVNVFFDLADNSKVDQSIFRMSDFYVKRMLKKKDYEAQHRLIPYGLYLPVYYKNSFLKYLFLNDLSYWKLSLKYWKTFSGALGVQDSIAVNEMSNIVSTPSENKKILFRSRLWDAGNKHPEWKRKIRRDLNGDRINLNHLLQEKFGEAFIGGIRKDNFATKECPELVLPEKVFHRISYLNKLKESSIGIATPGLEGSIGARFGEFMANGLAIVTNPIDEFQQLGPLREGEHYLSYRTHKECLEKTEMLFSNEKYRRHIQLSNREYYDNRVHPGAKLEKILDLIID